MSQVHGWKKYSAWRKHRAEQLRANRHGENIVHVEGLGSMKEAEKEAEKVEEADESTESV